VFAINPMSAVIAGWRWGILGEAAPDLGRTAVSVSVAMLVFALGLAVFRTYEPRFADTI
jgi:ABC-type polysaccharide/polyol phosphate export permease